MYIVFSFSQKNRNFEFLNNFNVSVINEWIWSKYLINSLNKHFYTYLFLLVPSNTYKILSQITFTEFYVTFRKQAENIFKFRGSVKIFNKLPDFFPQHFYIQDVHFFSIVFIRNRFNRTVYIALNVQNHLIVCFYSHLLPTWY